MAKLKACTTSPTDFISRANSGMEEAGGDEERKATSIGRGQKIKEDFGLDNIELALEVDGTSSGEFGGSPTNVAHSVRGSSSVTD